MWGFKGLVNRTGGQAYEHQPVLVQVVGFCNAVRPEILPLRQPGAAVGGALFLGPSILEDVMFTNGTVVPRRAKTQDTVSLTNWQKVIGVCLLLFYLAMIVITIATLPYVANVAIPHLTIFVP